MDMYGYVCIYMYVCMWVVQKVLTFTLKWAIAEDFCYETKKK